MNFNNVINAMKEVQALEGFISLGFNEITPSDEIKVHVDFEGFKKMIVNEDLIVEPYTRVIDGFDLDYDIAFFKNGPVKVFTLVNRNEKRELEELTYEQPTSAV
ncbi:hypothetical protein [Oceanobacillus neutriphilus]|uniref:Uncharacterized protein n=1 Tax=Oceanobacillus neutriphilus TaxID=531815 RepID=A0ABQ2P413_9BACI|nr:hypothetical protein [Oceanobacillus neutriphilus]GGP17176.1 hypothetical protein GCM10011346_52060 [Oceanobacillus neutriphilus]